MSRSSDINLDRVGSKRRPYWFRWTSEWEEVGTTDWAQTLSLCWDWKILSIILLYGVLYSGTCSLPILVFFTFILKLNFYVIYVIMLEFLSKLRKIFG